MKHLTKFDTPDDYKNIFGNGELEIPNVNLTSGKLTYHTDEPEYFYIKAIEDCTVKIQIYMVGGRVVNMYYRKSKQDEWLSTHGVTTNNSIGEITILAGETVWLKGIHATAAYNDGHARFMISGKCIIGGYVASLIYGDQDFANISVNRMGGFKSMFKDCTSIISAKNLKMPLSFEINYCFAYMFSGCNSLKEAPELPAMVLSNSCYSNMFSGCTSLEIAPSLPATVLPIGSQVTSQGNQNEACSCYNNMFSGCTSLRVAPQLPAIKLETSCYKEMFKGCSNLNYVDARFLNVNTSSNGINMEFYHPLTDWLSGVAATGTFVKNKDAEWDDTDTSIVPEGWTVVTK